MEVAPPPAAEPLHPAPTPFSRIFGQERALGILTESLRSGRVHHAWIFHGPMGVGKCTAALAFASLLLDPTTQETFGGGMEADPDGHVQRLLAAGTHPDLRVVRKELARFHEEKTVRDKKLTSIPIDVIRSFLLAPGYLAANLRNAARSSKVFIIDEAELLNTVSQNAVLKFLEEPPERTVVILVTNSEEQLLPTIRSRCQRVFFPPLTPDAMTQFLKGAGLELGKAEREWLLSFAEGCPGVLVAAKTGGLHEWAERLSPMLSAAMKGVYSIELGPAMAELVDGWAKAWVEAHDNASKEAANKAAADWMLRLVSAHLRAALRTSGARDRALHGLDSVVKAEREFDSNVNMQFVFEKLSGELAAGPAVPA